MGFIYSAHLVCVSHREDTARALNAAINPISSVLLPRISFLLLPVHTLTHKIAQEKKMKLVNIQNQFIRPTVGPSMKKPWQPQEVIIPTP